MEGLRARSANWRESAAIWAGTITERGWHAQDVYFHHDLGDNRSGPLFLDLNEQSKYILYDTLRQRGLCLVALIHTHPAEWVDLSAIDEQNQISSRIGFWSLVVPHYGRKPWNLKMMGVHERAETGWHRLSAKEIQRRIQRSND
jgi:proteasome lid subunit RPN8/RPN11